MSTIQIPYNFVARDYQKALYNAVMGGCKRAVAVWHRRAGKDKVFINVLAGKALERVGTYFYILPYYTQARKIVWEGFDKNGFPNINHFPPQLVKRRSNQEMVLELVNGSVVRFLGSDNIDSIVGTNPIGIVFPSSVFIKLRHGTTFVRFCSRMKDGLSSMVHRAVRTICTRCSKPRSRTPIGSGKY